METHKAATAARGNKLPCSSHCPYCTLNDTINQLPVYTNIYKYICTFLSTVNVDNAYLIVYNIIEKIGQEGSKMPINYDKLFALMEKKGIKKYDLRKMGVSPTIVDRLVKNTDVNTSTIARLCSILDCQPGDIMEYAEEQNQ